MKKKGFATSAILYTLLLLFIVLLVGILNNLQNKKTVLDQLKVNTVNALQYGSELESLLESVTKIESEIEDLKKKNIDLEKNQFQWSQTLLYSGNISSGTTNTVITLNDNYDNYKAFYIQAIGRNGAQAQSGLIPISHTTFQLSNYRYTSQTQTSTNIGVFLFGTFQNSNQLKINEAYTLFGDSNGQNVSLFVYGYK